MLRLTHRHPDYQTINDLMELIVLAKNPHMFFGIVVDVNEDECKAIIKTLENELDTLLWSIRREEIRMERTINASAFKEYLT